jgi:hypothetical protein
MSKLKLWNQYPNWEEAEEAWDEGAHQAAVTHPVKSLKILPQMPGMTEETKRFFKWKAFKWMVRKDKNWEIAKNVLKHPIKYGFRYFKSLFQSQPFKIDGDFYLYGVDSVSEFESLVKEKNNLFVLGFSYCHKPLECPSGRFTDQCIRDPNNVVCRQCFIGKALHASPEDTIPLIIPTVHYIGNSIFNVVNTNPDKQIIFIITACEMTLKMFGDWGNMVNIKGIGVRLDGRICNTMKAFELSEEGIKPGLTVVLDNTQQRILDLLKLRREKNTGAHVDTDKTSVYKK